jgi:histidinol-phosphatase (PHP family)
VTSIFSPQLISLHGGHSGEFCQHAVDTLEEIVCAYIAKGFAWVGITEHMPPVNDGFLFPDEREAGLTAHEMMRRFDRYMTACRRLQEKYALQIDILVGFETENYSNTIPFIKELINTYRPDYIVGSVHHVGNINFDFDLLHYQQAVKAAGSIDDLYIRYFDAQHELITTLKPPVVGHFDLIRMFDAGYAERLFKPEIEKRIDRNLSAIKKFGLVLDLNVRAFQKGAREPYVSQSILSKALDMKIPVVPGDDSHGVDTVGNYIKEGIHLLETMGFNTRWQEIVDRIKKSPLYP